jgi:hypothetical protein
LDLAVEVVDRPAVFPDGILFFDFSDFFLRRGIDSLHLAHLTLDTFSGIWSNLIS